MRFVDKVIKGEAAFNAFMDKFRPDWREYRRIENIWHFGELTVERFYERGPGDEYYAEWFWLVMPSRDPDKGFTDGQHSERRTEIYEKIRTGKIDGRI